MFLKNLLKSMTQPLNILIFLLAAGISYFVGSSVIFWVGMVIFLASSVMKLRDENFVNTLGLEQRVSEIRKLDEQCERLADGAKNSTNSEKRYRVREVLKDKNDIVGSLLRDKDNSLKQKIAKQAIELVMIYINLVENFYARQREIDKSKFSEIEQRIAQNEERMKNTNNIEAKADIENTVELDKRLLSRLNEEKEELERIKDKLSYIESSINLFKQQMVSSIESEDILNGVQDIINEAVALDNVMGQRRKERNRI